MGSLEFIAGSKIAGTDDVDGCSDRLSALGKFVGSINTEGHDDGSSEGYGEG